MYLHNKLFFKLTFRKYIRRITRGYSSFWWPRNKNLPPYLLTAGTRLDSHIRLDEWRRNSQLDVSDPAPLAQYPTLEICLPPISSTIREPSLTSHSLPPPLPTSGHYFKPPLPSEYRMTFLWSLDLVARHHFDIATDPASLGCVKSRRQLVQLTQVALLPFPVPAGQLPHTWPGLWGLWVNKVLVVKINYNVFR